MQQQTNAIQQFVVAYTDAERRADVTLINGIRSVHFKDEDKDALAKHVIENNLSPYTLANRLANIYYPDTPATGFNALRQRHDTRIRGFVSSYKRRLANGEVVKTVVVDKKTDLIKQAAKDAGVVVVDTKLTEMESGDVLGIPSPLPKMTSTDKANFKSNIIAAVAGSYKACARNGLSDAEWDSIVACAVSVAKTSIAADAIKPKLLQIMKEHGITQEQLVLIADLDEMKG